MMSNYVIMRSKKLSSVGNVASALQHCFRERETLNANSELTPNNEHFVAKTTDEAMGKMRNLLPEKRRKDAVLAIEYVFSASPDWWKNAMPAHQKEWKEKSLEWLQNKYGAENVIAASMHYDEKTPHLSAFVVPKTKDGRLSAKEFIGNRSLMSKDQTTYAKSVAYLGLERGIKGSTATHQRIKTHYGALEQPVGYEIPQVKPEEIKPQKSKADGLMGRLGLVSIEESSSMVADRINQGLLEQYKHLTDKAVNGVTLSRRAKELQRDNKTLAKRVETLEKPFKGLTKVQLEEVLTLTQKMRNENQIKEERQAKLRDEILQKARDAKQQERQNKAVHVNKSKDRGGFSR